MSARRTGSIFIRVTLPAILAALTISALTSLSQAEEKGVLDGIVFEGNGLRDTSSEEMTAVAAVPSAAPALTPLPAAMPEAQTAPAVSPAPAPAMQAGQSEPPAAAASLEDMLSAKSELQATPSPTPGFEFVPAGRKLSVAEEVLVAQIALADQSYRSMMMPATRDELVSVLEEAVARFCMNKLFVTLRHDAPPDDEVCRRFLQRLSEVNVNDAFLACAQKGIDSPECADAYEHQQVIDFPSAPATAAAAFRRAADSLALNNGAFLKARENLLGSIKLWHDNQVRATFERMQAAFDAELQTVCVKPFTVLVPTTQEELNAAKNPPTPVSPLLSELSQNIALMEQRSRPQVQRQPLIDGQYEDIFQKKTEEQEKEVSKDTTLYRRIRVITGQCRETSTEAMKLIPLHPASICHVNGFYTPQCIRAVRAQRQRAIQHGSPSGAPRAQDGLDAF